MIRFNCPNCNRPYELPPALAFLPLVCKQCAQRLTPPADQPDPPAAKPVAPAPPRAALPVAEIVAPPPAKAAVLAAKPVKPPVVAPTSAKPIAPAKLLDDDDDGVLVTKPDSTPDIDFNVGGPTAASLSDAARARPAGLSDANRPRPAELADPPPGIDELQKINLDLLGPAPPPVAKRVPKPPEPEPPEPKPEPTLLPFVADLVVFVALVFVGMLVGELLAKKATGQVLSEAGSAAKFPPVDLLLWGGPPVLLALVYLLLNARQLSAGAWLRRRNR